MVDTHCHINDIQFVGEVDTIVNNFLSAGIDCAICIGYDSKTNNLAKEISDEHKCVFYAVGWHPDECASYNRVELEAMLKTGDKKLVAVGEIGLDYFHNKDNKEEQKKVFIDQIALANKYRLPIVVHCRDAYGDTLEILKNHPAEFGAVMHCYSGSIEFARELLKIGVKISFTGSVTFKNATNLHEVAKNLPLDSFFFETDSPYLAPVPHRGMRNEPQFVQDVVKFVANLRGDDYHKLVKITDENAKKFFKIDF